jgi:CBS domain-containing protein
MLQSKTSSVLVLSNGKPVGIVTEKDFVKFFAFGVPSDEPLKNHMSRNLVTVDEDTSINDARNILVAHRIRHLPVVNKRGEAVGMVTVRDILETVQTLF